MKKTSENGFTFIDFSASPRRTSVGERKDNAFILYVKGKGGYDMTFSSPIKETVKKHNLYNLRLREDDLTGEVYIVFCQKENALKIRTNMKNKGRGDMGVSNKDLYDYLSKGDYSGLVLILSENLSNSDQYATYKIISREKLHKKSQE